MIDRKVFGVAAAGVIGIPGKGRRSRVLSGSAGSGGRRAVARGVPPGVTDRQALAQASGSGDQCGATVRGAIISGVAYRHGGGRAGLSDLVVNRAAGRIVVAVPVKSPGIGCVVPGGGMRGAAQVQQTAQVGRGRRFHPRGSASGGVGRAVVGYIVGRDCDDRIRFADGYRAARTAQGVVVGCASAQCQVSQVSDGLRTDIDPGQRAAAGGQADIVSANFVGKGQDGVTGHSASVIRTGTFQEGNEFIKRHQEGSRSLGGIGCIGRLGGGDCTGTGGIRHVQRRAARDRTTGRTAGTIANSACAPAAFRGQRTG